MIDDFRLIIPLSRLWLEKTVLIGVDQCLTEGYLKKQTQIYGLPPGTQCSQSLLMYYLSSQRSLRTQRLMKLTKQSQFVPT